MKQYKLKSGRGGARKGAGRPGKEKADKTTTRTVKLTDKEHGYIVATYGGFSAGVRTLLDGM